MSISNPNFIYKDFDESRTANYNKIWNWYLNNLKNGEFEQILNNHDNSVQLNKFIDELIDDDTTLIMIIPNIINSTMLLQDLLTKFFVKSSGIPETTDSISQVEITITNLGPLFQSQSSLIMATSKFIYTNDLKSQQYSFGQISNYNRTIDLNSIISGESGYTPSFNDPTMVPPPPNSNTFSDVIDDTESSIDSYHPSGSILPSPKYSLTRVTTIQNDGSLTHVPNSPRSSSEIQPVVQIESKESRDSEGEEEEEDDVQSSSMIGDVECHDVNSVYSNDSSIESLDYVPSMITTRTKKLNIRYKLILSNILFRDEDNQEKRTAIRQIDEEGISDDWLLYDSKFRMNNLELLDLREIIEMMKYERKLLVYDLVLEKMGTGEEKIDQEEEEELEDFEGVQDNDLNVVEFNGKEEVDQDEDHDDDYGTSIKFTQSNQTTITPSIKLTKTNTTNTIKTNYGSIKSEMNLYKPDTLFTKVERSKSTPNNHNSSTKMKKFKIKHNNHTHSSDRCVIV